MSNLDTFTQFLNSSYKKILQACLEDEAVQTLKILENKEYLQLRINELFSEIYVIERQKKIEELMNIVNSQQKAIFQQNKSLQAKCQTCELFQKQNKQKQRQIAELNRKLSEMTAYEYKETKRVESLLLKDNQQLKKQLRQLQAELTQVLISQNSQREMTSIQFLRYKQQTNKEVEQRQKEIQGLRTQLLNKIEESKALQNRLLQTIQKREAEEREVREVAAQMKNANFMREKQQNEITILKNQQNLLNQKISRLQLDNQFLKQRAKLQEKQHSKLKNLNNELLLLNRNQGSQAKSKSDEQDSSDLLNKIQNTIKVNLQLQRQNKSLKQQFEIKVKQLQESNIFLEKNSFAVSQELRKNQIRYDKEVRQLKEELKRLNDQARTRFDEEKSSQVDSIVKKFKRQQVQVQKQLEKTKEENRSLARNLLKSQQTLNQVISQHQEQKKQLLEQIQKEKNFNKEMKNHIKAQKSSTQLIELQNQEKLKQLEVQVKNLKKELEVKEKEIKEMRKQVGRRAQQQNSKNSLMDNLKNRCQRLQNTIDQAQKQTKKVRQLLKNKEKLLKQLNKKLQTTLQEKDESQKKLSNLNKSLQLSELRIKKLSEQLSQKRQVILSLQQNNQSEIMDIYDHTQAFASQNRRQIESYYMNLLKQQQESKTNIQLKQMNQMNQQEISELMAKKNEVQQKMLIFKAKYGQELKQRSSYEEKIVKLLSQIQNLRIENTKLSEMLREQKRNTTALIRGYQEKFIQYYNIFGQFKRQLHLNLKAQLLKIKQDLRQIATFAQTEIQKSKEWFAAYCYKLLQETETLNTNHKLKYEKLKYQYDFGIVFKLQEEKRQMKVQLDLQLKQKSMEFYTIIAEKEHIIRQKEQTQARLNKKMSEMEVKNEQIQKIARQNFKKQEEIKEIMNKMNYKVNEAEKQSSSLKNQLQYYKKENMELKKEMNSLQLSFKEKIQKCRESYALQNQRLFAKYEKEFGRLIVSNKKGLQYSSLMNHSNSCNNMLIPTKGCHNDNKLERIQKQIQQQKKKLNILEQGMEDKTKLQKTSKIVNKDHLKTKK